MSYEATSHDIQLFRESLAIQLADIPSDELREESCSPDDATCSRFLRARKGQIPAAVSQYVEAEKWFKEVNIDTILEEPDINESIYQQYCPHANLGYDREGRPIYFERTGAIKLPEVLKILTPADLVTRHIRQQAIALSRLEDSSRRMKKPVEKQVILLDLKNLSLRPDSVGLSIFKECIRIDQAFFPERLECFFFLNSPWIFRPLWAIVRPWLDPVTKRKFHVLGSKYQEELFKLIDKDQLPPEFGGTANYEFPHVRPEVTRDDSFARIPTSDYDEALRPRLSAPTATGAYAPLDEVAQPSTPSLTLLNGSLPTQEKPLPFDLNALCKPIEAPKSTQF
eukprot:m.46610 g.46610  ORF g.46610 m.46610 type:complete len:339 (-) comp13160_c0_seq2:10-1026(-)